MDGSSSGASDLRDGPAAEALVNGAKRYIDLRFAGHESSERVLTDMLCELETRLRDAERRLDAALSGTKSIQSLNLDEKALAMLGKRLGELIVTRVAEAVGPLERRLRELEGRI